MVPIEALAQCPALAALPKHRLRATARASRFEEFQAEDSLPMTPDRMYVLLEGTVAVQLRLDCGAQCGGKASFVVHGPGHMLGWQSVVKSGRLREDAVCRQAVRVVAIDLLRLRSSETGFELMRAAAACLYALSVDIGLCPRSVPDRVLLGAEHCQWTDVERAARDDGV